MSPKVELTVAVLVAIREMHFRAYHGPPTNEQVEAYVSMLKQSLANFESTYAGIPFFTASPVHAFEAISISGSGDRYPRFSLRLSFLRRGSGDYLVATPTEIRLGESYDSIRLLEEARHIEKNMTDLPATNGHPPETE